MGRLLDSWADFVTRRRGAVLVAVAVLVAICAAALPRLTTDTAPENLLISYGGYHERVHDFRARFGDTDSVVAILVVADDVLTLEPLRYIHQLTNELGADERVIQAISITTAPVPTAPEDAGDEGGGLDDLDDLSLDDLGDEDAGALPETDPRFEAALQVLIGSEPARFPLGMLTVADRVGGESDIRPLVPLDRAPEAGDVTRIVGAFEHQPMLRGRLVSGDRRVAAVVLVLDPALGTGDPRVRAVHELDTRLEGLPPPAGIEVYPAGLPHLRAAISDAMIQDQIVLVPGSLIVCILILALSFRWLAGTVLPIVTVGLTVVSVLGLMAIVGEPLTILMNTVPTLLIVVGIAESVHVIGRYMDEARRLDRITAAKRTLTHLAVACFLAAFTTAVGFASLTVAQTEMLRRFGVVAAVGVLVGYLLLMSFVPAALTYFAPPAARKLSDATTRGAIERILVPLTNRLLRRPWIAIGVGVVLCAAASWTFTQVRSDTSLIDTFEPTDPVVIATHLVDDHLDGIRPLEVFVQSDDEGRMRDPEVLAALDRVAVWAVSEDGVLRATSANDLLHATWNRVAGMPEGAREEFHSADQVVALSTLLSRFEPSPLAQYLTPDGRATRLELRLGDVGARRSIEIIHALEARLADELGGLEGVRFSLLGEGYIGSLGVDSVVDDLFGSLSLSACICFLTIGLLFRSWRLGLIAIPTNVLPQLGTVAWMVIRGIPLDASTAVVFSVVIGVTVDLTIHGFARYLEEREAGFQRRAALLRTARGTGRAMVVGTVTLVLGFGVLLFSGFVPIRHFGELIAAALFLSLSATLFLQPPLMKLFAPDVAKKL